MKRKSETKLLKLSLNAIFIAIIAVMSFTPLGYLKVGVIEISLLAIPVAAGAALLGPIGGLVQGLAFGLSSFIQCFGMSAFGTALFGINPVFTAILCIVPRALMGLFTGLLYNGLRKTKIQKNITSTLTFLCCALFNTILFIGGFILMFYHTSYFAELSTSLGATNIFGFIGAFVGVNGLVEAAAGGAVGAAMGIVIEKLRAKI